MPMIEIDSVELAELRDRLAKAETRGSELQAQLFEARGDKLDVEARLNAANAERDSLINAATATHRDAVTRGRVANALAKHAGPAMFGYAIDIFMANVKVELTDSGLIKELQLPNGRTVASLDVAAELFTTDCAPIFHRDWSIEQQRIIPGASSGTSPRGQALQDLPDVNESADVLLSYGLAQKPAPIRRASTSGPDLGIATVDELLSGAFDGTEAA